MSLLPMPIVALSHLRTRGIAVDRPRRLRPRRVSPIVRRLRQRLTVEAASRTDMGPLK